MSIQAVFFDVGGTLLQPVNPGEVYARTAARHGSTRTAAELLVRFRTAFVRQEQADQLLNWQTGTERERIRWRAIVSEVLDDVNDLDACFDELYEAYASAAGWSLEPGAAEVLAVLAGRGLTVGLASNFDTRLERLAAEIPALAAVPIRIVSETVGWRKPARAFFEHVVLRANGPADAILYVGDDLGNDYHGARAAGLHALLYDPAGRSVGVERITHLTDLLTHPLLTP